MTFSMDQYKLKVINIWLRRYQLKMWFSVKLVIQILPSVSKVPEYKMTSLSISWLKYQPVNLIEFLPIFGLSFEYCINF